MNYDIIKDLFKIYANHYHKSGDYSVTEIIDPPRVVALNNRYPECNETIEMIRSTASLVGTGVHKYIEQLMKPYESKYQLEQNMKTKILDRVLSGTYDILSKGKTNDLYDIKTCKVWKLIFDPNMVDWHKQQNIYKWMADKNGIRIDSINILAVYMDWVEGNVVRNKSYPKEPMIIYPLEMWSDEKTENFITDRMKLHIGHEETPDEDLPACTPEERWGRFPEGVTEKFAIFKTKESKRAVRVLLTKEDAVEYCRTAKGLGSNSFVEVRYAARKRCEKYCSVNTKCNHYQTYINNIENDTLNDIIPYDLVMQVSWI